jgi:hypothetical protein
MFHKYYYVVKINEGAMRMVQSIHKEDEKCLQNFSHKICR